MSRMRHALSARDAHITTLRLVIGALALLCLCFFWGWKSAPERLTVYTPPDLRTGSTREWWKVPEPNVYTFAIYVWQTLNRWPVSGEADYKRNIDAYRNFLTPACVSYLQRDYAQRRARGELKGRVRGIYEIPGRGFQNDIPTGPGGVKVIDRDHWVVTADMGVSETYAGTTVRDTYVRYPLYVSRVDNDPNANPWGLQIGSSEGCFSGVPQRLGYADSSDTDTGEGATP